MRFLRVPTLKSRNVQEPMESSVMVSTCRKRGHNARGGRGGWRHPQCTYFKRMGHVNYFTLHDFPDQMSISKVVVAEPKFSKEYQGYMRLKSNNLAQSSTYPSLHLTIHEESKPTDS